MTCSSSVLVGVQIPVTAIINISTEEPFRPDDCLTALNNGSRPSTRQHSLPHTAFATRFKPASFPSIGLNTEPHACKPLERRALTLTPYNALHT